jgi:hypothetical protein
LTLSVTKAGFGLGALNEAEDDDVDIYDMTTHADRTYMPYDAIRDADEASGVNRSKSIRKVARIFSKIVVDWFLVDYYNATAVPKWDDRTYRLRSLSGPRTEGAMVTVS